MNKASWLRLAGTRYRCVPLYLPEDEFDPLSRLFLDVLKYEHNVSRLVRAFGLTERVVEDILGDLIRRNRAVLVVQNGVKELRLVDEAMSTIVHEPGETLDVWQDESTGLVLPAWIVDPFVQPRAEKGEAVTDSVSEPLELRSGLPLVEKFLDAPDGQIIEMLLRSDDDLRHRDEASASLDRLADRHRVRPQTLWLPVLDAEIQGQVIPLIMAESIPSWVARVWSVALRRDSLHGPGEEVAFHSAATAGEEGFQLVHGWRASAQLEAWRNAVSNFLNQLPPPLSGYDLRKVREKQAALTGLLLSVGKVEVLDVPNAGSAAAWLQSVFEGSRNWIALVLPWPAQIEVVLDLIKRRVESNALMPSKIFVVLPSTSSVQNVSAVREALQRLLGATRFPLVIRRDWPSDGPSVALGDCPEVQVRYAPQSSVLRFTGGSLATEWLRIIQALPRNNGSGEDGAEVLASDLLRPLRVRRDTIQVEYKREARLGLGPDASSVAMALDELRGFGEDLLTAIVDPELLLRTSGDGAEAASSASRFDRQRPLAQQVPILNNQLDVLCHHLSLAPAAPWAYWGHLGSHELLPTLAALFNEPSRRSVEGEIHILASGLLSEVCSDSVVNLLERAVAIYGWTVEIGLSKNGGQVGKPANEALSVLRSRIPSPRLRFWELPRPVPAHALVLDDLVFLAGGDWLSSVLREEPRSSDFGFYLESRELAESLRACFAAGRPLAPGSGAR